MKLLLINPSNEGEIPLGTPRNYSQEARSHLPPLGLLYLAGYLKARHDVKVVDMMVSGQDRDDVSGILQTFEPDLVGISAIISLWPSVLDIIRIIKQYNSAIPIVLGGPNATQYPVESLSHSEIDYLIVGYGQEPLMLLCNQIERGETGKGIDNCYAQNVPYTSYQKSFPIEYDLDAFPRPDRSAIPFEFYHVDFCPENPSTTMISSTGCPFRCAFCNCNHQIVHIRSADHVVAEMQAIQAMGIRSILFQDEIFTMKPKRVRVICEQLIEKRIQVHWSIKSRIDCIKPWMPELMKKAGCFNIHFGIESGTDTTLARMNKGFTVEQVRQTVSVVKDAGLSCTGNFMLAYPGENANDIRQTITFAKELELDLAQFSITLDLPKTPMFDEAIKAGRRDGDPWSAFVKNPERVDLIEMFASDRFSPETLFEFLNEAYSSMQTLFDYKAQ